MEDELDIGSIKHDLFGDELKKDSPVWVMREGSNVSKYILHMSTAIKEVLHRQYKSYLSLNKEEIDLLTEETG